MTIFVTARRFDREMTDSPKQVPTSPPSDTNILDTIISSSGAVSSRLKTLEKEHQLLLNELPQDQTNNEEMSNDFECLLVQEKQRVLTESMKKLHYGLNEAKVRKWDYYGQCIHNEWRA